MSIYTYIGINAHVRMCSHTHKNICVQIYLCICQFIVIVQFLKSNLVSEEEEVRLTKT